MPPHPESFDQLEASLLFCPQCRQAMPVRKRLLLVLPGAEKFDYVCTRCGALCGDKLEPNRAAPPVRRG
ncbi:MAG: hypothetical protein HY699_18600 [Deltaproteobacteria bacterium]|nr:hypothetical protein [Deltaproteobacteria bacterium]